MISAKKGFLIVAVILVLLFTTLIFKPKEYDCGDFKTQLQAYTVFRKNPIDVYHLDADYDQVPCESLPVN